MECLISEMQVKLRGALTADDGGFTRFARVLEGRVGASGWFVGDRPTAADIRMFTQMSALKRGMLEGIPADCFAPYPKLEALYEKLSQIPGAVLAKA